MLALDHRVLKEFILRPKGTVWARNWSLRNAVAATAPCIGFASIRTNTLIAMVLAAQRPAKFRRQYGREAPFNSLASQRLIRAKGIKAYRLAGRLGPTSEMGQSRPCGNVRLMAPSGRSYLSSVWRAAFAFPPIATEEWTWREVRNVCRPQTVVCNGGARILLVATAVLRSNGRLPRCAERPQILSHLRLPTMCRPAERCPFSDRRRDGLVGCAWLLRALSRRLRFFSNAGCNVVL